MVFHGLQSRNQILTKYRLWIDLQCGLLGISVRPETILVKFLQKFSVRLTDWVSIISCCLLCVYVCDQTSWCSLSMSVRLCITVIWAFLLHFQLFQACLKQRQSNWNSKVKQGSMTSMLLRGTIRTATIENTVSASWNGFRLFSGVCFY